MSDKLWGDTNGSLRSSVFSVPAGKVAVLFGQGFADEIARDTGSFVTPQTACTHRLLFQDDSLPQEVGCGGVFDFNKLHVTAYLDEEVLSCDGAWQLTKCRNIAIIGVPGVYQLVLNGRGTDGGKPQVYMELYDINQIAPQHGPLFFN